MTETTRLTTFVPGFGGFHGSRWENLFPFSRDRCAERFAKYEGADELTAADLGAILRETSDASRFFASLAARFCRRYDAEVSRWLGFELGLMFDSLDIPVGRGGTTDFILATIPVNSARKLFARSAEEGHQRLVQSIRDRFALYGDVVPYPEDAGEQWLTEPIERWDRAALCDLLAGFVDPEIDERLYADMTAGSDVRMSFENAVDWTRFADLVAARRHASPTAVVADAGETPHVVGTRRSKMPQQTMLEGYVPDFSGFSSPAWTPLLSGPRDRAAEAHAFLQMHDEFDREDFLTFFAASADAQKQRSALASSFWDIFAIRLALKLGIPLLARFARYEPVSDRIVVSVPLGTVRWLLDHCARKRHRPLDGLKPSEFEALWDFDWEAGSHQSEAVSRALDMMDAVAVGKLLRAFGNPGIEKTAIRAIAVDAAAQAFADSIDPDKYRTAKERRRREKRAWAFARPGNA